MASSSLGLITPAPVTLVANFLSESFVRPDVLDLALAAVGLLVALEVAEEADHLALEQGWPAALRGRA